MGRRSKKERTSRKRAINRLRRLCGSLKGPPSWLKRLATSQGTETASFDTSAG